MAIIYSYPQVNSSSDLAASDLMIISDMSANGRPTKALKLSDLATFITNTGTGSGTTNKITRWSDGPSGVLGDSILAQDTLATQLTLTGNFITTGTGNFTGQVTIPITPAAATDAASKNYVDTEIAGIPAGLVFKGNWNANTNTPTLASGTGTVGNYYVVSVAGNTDLDGITDWQVGDWAVFVEVGGVDKWDKIDQTFVSGSGAAGQVTFWNTINTVDGDNDFYWDNVNKRLGIGTTSPAEKLEVAGNIGINQYILHNNDLNTFFGFPGNDTVSVGTNGVERMRVNSSGNVGIGTTSPSEKLDVVGNINLDGTSTRVFFGGNNTFVGENSNSNELILRGGGSTVSESVYIDTSGNVGIGTSNPGYNLHVKKSGTNSAITIEGSTNSGANFSSKLNFSNKDISGNDIDFTIGLKKTNNFVFMGDAAANELIRIEGNTGDVGIGTTNPSEKLEVNGNILVDKGTTNRTAYVSDDGLYISRTTVANSYTSSITADSSSSGNNLNIKARSRIDLILNGNTTLVADDLGKVGIGTDSPDSLLEIASGTTTDFLKLTSTGSGASPSKIIFEKSATEQGIVEYVRNGDLRIYNTDSDGGVLIDGSSASGNDLYVKNDGNVGIGTTSPSAKLDVVGRIGLNDGNDNVLVGSNAGDALTTGSFNVALGSYALTNEDTGGKSIAIGYAALENQNNGSDNYNIAIGHNAGKMVSTGIYNTLMGGLAGDALTTGDNNVAIGYQALTNEQTGGRNVAIGTFALQDLNTGINAYNVAVGHASGAQMTSGVNNVLIGGLAGDALTTGSNNVAIGSGTLSADDAGGRNVAIGSNALTNQNGGTLNVYNIGIGYNAGAAITSAVQTTLIGGLSGDAITTGEFNTAVGYNTLSTVTTGGRNVAMGWSSLRNVTGSGNRYNSALGFSTGENITSGVQNTIVGGLAGTTIVDGDNLTVLGYNAEPSAANATDEVTLGDSGVSTLRCAVTTITAISDERDKTNIEELPYGLDFVDSLKPKKFVWNHRPEIKKEVDAEGNETEVEFYSSRKGSKDIGFIAQELDQIDDEYTRLVYKSNPDKLEASYGRLIPILVKAIQELSAEVKMLKNK